MSDDYEIRFRCTDRDNHPSRELLILRRYVDGGEMHRMYLDMVVRGEQLASEWGTNPLYIPSSREGKRTSGRDRAVLNGSKGKDIERGVWRMPCPSCRRDFHRREEKLVALMDKLHAAGVSTVDVSKLPVN